MSTELDTRPTLNVRCTAHRTNGQPCKRWAIRGATVCASHGGLAPQVRAAAARRIEASLDRAAVAVVRLMEDPETPPGVKLAAAKDLLDRGFGSRHVVQVQTPEAPWLAALRRISLAAAGLDVIDAEVIEDDEPRALSESREQA
jgi:hypothetical protein